MDRFKPTLRDRLQTMGLLLNVEAPGLPDYIPKRNRAAFGAALLAGWRQVMRIRARAMVQGVLGDQV